MAVFVGWLCRDKALCSQARCFFSFKAAILLQSRVISQWCHTELCSPLQGLEGRGSVGAANFSFWTALNFWWLKLKAQAWLFPEGTEHTDLHESSFQCGVQVPPSSWEFLQFPILPRINIQKFLEYI